MQKHESGLVELGEVEKVDNPSCSTFHCPLVREVGGTLDKEHCWNSSWSLPRRVKSRPNFGYRTKTVNDGEGEGVEEVGVAEVEPGDRKHQDRYCTASRCWLGEVEVGEGHDEEGSDTSLRDTSVGPHC